MSSSDNHHVRVQGPLSDRQMDQLLRDFFQLEVPGVLPTAGASSPVLHRAVPAVFRPATSMRSARLAAGLALAALVLCALVLNHDSERTATMAARAKLSGPTDAMLVSPQGATGDRQVPVGADGLLLQETDQIQLAPQRQPGLVQPDER